MRNAGAAISSRAEKAVDIGQPSRSAGLVVGVVLFSLLTCWGARLSIPLPGTPVPATLQTLPVLMAGLFLGAGPGCLSQAAYLALGLGGLPVFALPGSGPAYLLGPTGGYLLGFLAAPLVVGRVARRPGAGTPRRLAALVLGLAVLHACGFAGLLPHLSGSAAAVLRAGFVPFALFDVAKVIGALALYAGWLALGRRIDPGWRNRSRS